MVRIRLEDSTLNSPLLRYEDELRELFGFQCTKEDSQIEQKPMVFRPSDEVVAGLLSRYGSGSMTHFFA